MFLRRFKDVYVYVYIIVPVYVLYINKNTLFLKGSLYLPLFGILHSFSRIEFLSGTISFILKHFIYSSSASLLEANGFVVILCYF